LGTVKPCERDPSHIAQTQQRPGSVFQAVAGDLLGLDISAG
jgi:hypothetical protein